MSALKRNLKQPVLTYLPGSATNPKNFEPFFVEDAPASEQVARSAHGGTRGQPLILFRIKSTRASKRLAIRK